MSERLVEDTLDCWIESMLMQLKVKEDDPVSAIAEPAVDNFFAG